MKKYTNKILIIAMAAFLVVFTILLFVKTSEIKKEIKNQKSTELIINH